MIDSIQNLRRLYLEKRIVKLIMRRKLLESKITCAPFSEKSISIQVLNIFYKLIFLIFDLVSNIAFFFIRIETFYVINRRYFVTG